MRALQLALVVLSALVCPSLQILTEPDACSVLVNPYTRPKCGVEGVSRTDCLRQGCCFYEPTPGPQCKTNAGTCYKPVNCENGPNMFREEMGWKLISRQACNCRGGCFDNSDPSKVQCYKPHPDDLCAPREFKGEIIAMNNYKTIKQVTAEQCRDICVKDSTKKCKTAEYHAGIKRCFLSMKKYEDAKKQFLLRKHKDFTMFAVCPDAVPPPNKVDDICEYKAYDTQILAGNSNFGNLRSTMSLDECKQECNKAKAAGCKGFEYNKLKQRCFLMNITYEEGKSQGNLRTDRVDWVTYSCPYTGPPLTTPAPPAPPTDPPVVNNETLPICVNKQVDLVMVLDESSSILPEDFDKIQEFAEDVVRRMPISSNMTQIGLITFSSSPVTHMYPTNGKSRVKVLHAIHKVDQRGGNTYTNDALKSMTEILTTDYLTGGRTPVARIGVVVTDGASKNKTATLEKAQAAKDLGIKLIAVGVGDFDKDEINQIASNENSTFTVDDFEKLFPLVDKIATEACRDAPKTPEQTTTPKPPYDPATLPKYCKDIPVVNRTVTNKLYWIDPDGPFTGSDPIRVECDFTGNPPISIIHTRQEVRSCYKECSERKNGCFVQRINYFASMYATRNFVKFASRCEFPVNYDCYRSAIDYRRHDSSGPKTYWVNYKNQKMSYWPGGKVDGGCGCGKTGTCFLNYEKCQCDARDNQWRSDNGVLTDQIVLPVKDIAIGDIAEKGQEACFTAGPLKCV